MPNNATRKRSNPVQSASGGGATTRGERRTRLRLRDLCDEVIASHRAARGQDAISSADRQVANELLGRIAPL
jgi:hypothetical protein